MAEEHKKKAGSDKYAWRNGQWMRGERDRINAAWESLRQYPRRVVDAMEKIRDRKIRILTPEEQDAEDCIDPCPGCICTRFMGEGYCDRPCRAYIRHYDYVRRQAAGRLRNGQ